MWYPIFVNLATSEFFWSVLLVIAILITHHALNRRKGWAVFTAIAFSFAVGWLTETLGLGWFAAQFFGSVWVAIAAYLGAGLVWLAIQVIIDGPRVTRQFDAYATAWCRDHGRGEWALADALERRSILKDLLPELRDRTRNSKSPPAIYPPHYPRSADRLFWIVTWFFLWPVFLIDTLFQALIFDPWRYIRALLQWYVSLILRFVVSSSKYPDMGRDPLPPNQPEFPTRNPSR